MPPTLAPRTPIDVPALVASRMLIVANSGAGKSWALRRTLEQTHDQIQHIVLDVEDEFHTLREKYDCILARPSDGDCVAHPKTAKLLARKLLECGVSAIVAIYELKAHERMAFMRLFLDALVNAPKALWHPVLVVIDEAHVFCPQAGKAESAAAVIDLMTRGRKRGFCGVLATQRISKLHKDAAAEANNKLIGRCSLDVDMKRAADELGFSGRDDQRALRTMEPGEFFVFGPALSPTVDRVKIGGVATTHPRPGQTVLEPPPASAKVRAALAELTELPQEAEQEARTVDELQREVARLKRARPQAQTDPAVIETARAAAFEQGHAAGYRDCVAKIGETLPAHLTMIQESVAAAQHDLAACARSEPSPRPAPSVPPKSRSRAKAMPVRSDTVDIGPEKKPLAVLVGMYPAGCTEAQWATQGGYARKGGTWQTYKSRLRSNGHIEERGGMFYATDTGVAALGGTTNVDQLPTDTAGLVDYWASKITAAGRMLRYLADQYPTRLTRDELAIGMGMTATGGSFQTYLSRLRSNELIEEDDLKQVRIRGELFNMAA